MTYRELKERLLQYERWLGERGLAEPPSRYSELVAAVDYVDEAWRSGQVSTLLDGDIGREAAWRLCEAAELEKALSALVPLDPRGFEAVLRIVLAGRTGRGVPPTPASETADESNNARNSMFELLVGAHLSRRCSGLAFAEPDVTCTVAGRSLAIACKRPFRRSGLRYNVDKARAQLRGAGGESLKVLALALDRVIVELPGSGLPDWETEDAARVALQRATDYLCPELEALLEHSAIDLVICVAVVPAVVGDLGLKRCSEVTVIDRGAPPLSRGLADAIRQAFGGM